MKFSKHILAAMIATSPVAALAEAITTTPDGYTLRWADEFNAEALNEAIWNIEVNGNGGGNQELQYYKRENVTMEADPKTGERCLVLTARRESFGGKSFTSGRVTSQNKAAFRHGMIQARIKFPATKDGLWPAYWMMGNDMSKYGWPRCGEMDIVELGHANGIKNGTQDRYFGGTLHYGPNATNQGHQQFSQEYLAPADNPITDGEYHIITVEWDDVNLYMYYDLEGYTNAKKRQARYFTCGVEYEDGEYSVGHYFQKPFFFLFNLAVGGTYPGIYNANGITALPNAGDEAKMYVDWVRVYQKDDDANAQYTYIDENGNCQSNIEEEPEPEPGKDDKTELSGFATEALDANGETTFDFSDVSDAVLISTSDGVRGHLLNADANVTDYNVNNTNRNLYIWENTYVAVNRDGHTNSFGWDEGYNKFTVASVGWSGLGFNIANEDLSMVDDSWWLHFAMRGTDVDMHTSHEVNIGKAKFIVGKSNGKLASVGDFKRDGKWYYFDIPVKALGQFSSAVFGSNPKAFNDNIVAFISGGVTDAELCIDNIFFYKSKSKEIPSYTDTKADLGKYGYKSLDEDGNPVFSFDNITDIVPLFLSGDTWESLTAGGTYENSLVKPETDNSEQGGRNNFFVWDNTMQVKMVNDVPNSFGRTPYGGFPTYGASSTAAWTGAGWASIAGQGMEPKPLNLSTIDDSYYLHFSVRSSEAVSHIPVQIRLGSDAGKDALITLGSYSTKPIFADFNRDGEWYSFDIPVAVLKQYGQFWSNAAQKGGLAAYTDYSLCIYTGDTFYDNSFFGLDNVFFYKTDGKAPEVNPLGEYTTKSLDENGESYFDFTGKEFINISGNGQVMGRMYDQGDDAILYDLRDGVGASHFYVWSGTYTDGPAIPAGTVHSFGGDEGWINMTVGTQGWSGCGWVNDDGVDLTVLENGNWHLHFAMRGTDDAWHNIGFGEGKFTIGSTAQDGALRLGDYARDGEWYSFDIPYSKLKTLSTDLWPSNNGGQSAYKSNIVWINSGNQPGKNIQIDNIFLWRDKEATEGIGDINAPAEEEIVLGIYDMMGRAVGSTEAPGLYIIRTNLGARKVLVK